MKQRILRFLKKSNYLINMRLYSQYFGFSFFLLLFSCITLPTMGQVVVTQSPTSICNNVEIINFQPTDVDVFLTASGKPDATYTDGGTYQWFLSPTGGVQQAEGNSIKVNDIIEAATFDVTFYVQYVDQNEKTSPRTAYDLAFQGPTAEILQGTNIGFCGQSTLTLCAKPPTSTSPAISYQWQKSGSSGTQSNFQDISLTDNADAQNSSITLTNSDIGVYRLRVTQGGCTVFSYAINVLADLKTPEIVTNNGNKLSFCGGDNLTLYTNNVNGVYRYRWQRKNLLTGVEEWVTPLQNTDEGYLTTDEDKDNAGSEDGTATPKYEYRVAIYTYDLCSSSPISTPICEDVFSAPITLEKKELPKAQVLDEFGTPFITFSSVSSCPVNDETDLNPKAKEVKLVATKIMRDDITYRWYKSNGETGAGVLFGSFTLSGTPTTSTPSPFITATESGYYYMVMDDGSCVSEPSHRIYVDVIQYEAPKLTTDKLTIDPNDPVIYVCNSGEPIIATASFNIPITSPPFTSADFEYFWAYTQGSGSRTGGGVATFTTVASGNQYTFDPNDPTIPNGTYYMGVKKTTCPDGAWMIGKPFKYEKFDLNIKGTVQLEGSVINTTDITGKNQVIQLCPKDKFTLEPVRLESLTEDPYDKMSISWSKANLDPDGKTLPDAAAFSATTEISGDISKVGHYVASISIPGKCDLQVFVTVQGKTVEIEGTPEFCKGEQANISVIAGLQNYQWQYSNDGSSYTPLTGATSRSLTTSTAGFYKMIATESGNACPIESDPVEVKETEPPTVVAKVKGTAVTNRILYCSDAEKPEVNIELVPAFTSVSYTWTKYKADGITFITILAEDATTGTLTVHDDADAPAIYRLKVVTGGCEVTKVYTVKKPDNTEQVKVNPSAGQRLCPGVNTKISGGEDFVDDNFNFEWQKKVADVWTKFTGATSNNGRVAVLASTDAGLYRLKVTGCTKAAPTVTVYSGEINMLPPPDPYVAPQINGGNSQAAICSDKVKLRATPTGIGYTYVWYRDGVVITGLGSTTSEIEVTKDKLGVYKAEVKYGASCVDETQPITVTTDNPVFGLTANPTDLSPGCNQSAITINGATSADYNFNWYVGEISSSRTGGSVSWNLVDVEVSTGKAYNENFISVSEPGTYQVELDPKDASSGCPSVTLSVVVGGSSKELGILPLDSTQLAITCKVVHLKVSNEKYPPYVWTGPDGKSTVGFTTSADRAGEYTLTANVCGNTITDKMMIVGSPDIPRFSGSKPYHLCGDGTRPLVVANPVFGSTYSWFKQDASGVYQPITPTTPDPSKSHDVIIQETGTYKVSYECDGIPLESEPVFVGDSLSLTVAIDGDADQPVCKGGTTVLTVKSIKSKIDGYIWQKYKGGKYENLVSPDDGTYTVKADEISGGDTSVTSAKYRVILDIGGCHYSSSDVTVTIRDSPSNPEIEAEEICPGGTAELKLKNIPNDYIWQVWDESSKKWDDVAGSKNKAKINVPSGTYQVIGTVICDGKNAISVISDTVGVAGSKIAGIKIIPPVNIPIGAPKVFEYCETADLQIEAIPVSGYAVSDATAILNKLQNSDFVWYKAGSTNPVGVGRVFALNKDITLDGTYRVEVKLSTSCTLEASLPVQASPGFKSLTFSTSTYIPCQDGSVTLEVIDPINKDADYEWRYAEGAPSSFDKATPLTKTKQDASTGKVRYTFSLPDKTKSYYVYVKASHTICGEVENSAEILPASVNTVAKIAEDVSTDPIIEIPRCPGSTRTSNTFKLTTLTPGVQYVWLYSSDEKNVPFTSVPNPSADPKQLVVTVDGFYKIAVQLSSSCPEFITSRPVKVVSSATTGDLGNVALCADADSVILKQPIAGNLGAGDTFQWYRSTTGKTGAYTAIAGATGATHKITLLQSQDIATRIATNSGWYKAEVTQKCTGVDFVHTYYMNVVVSSPPSSTAVELNASGKKDYCHKNGSSRLKALNPITNGSVTYQWQRVVGTLNQTNLTFVDIPGATNSILDAVDIDGNQTDNEGTYYRLVASNGDCSVESDAVYLIASDKSPKAKLEGNGAVDMCINPDGSKYYTLKVKEDLSSKNTYKWIRTDGSSPQVLANTVGLTELTVFEAGTYKVEISDLCGNVSESDVLKVKDTDISTTAPIISQAKGLGGKPYVYCLAFDDKGKPLPTELKIENPSSGYDYIWIHKATASDPFVTVGTDPNAILSVENTGDPVLIIRGETTDIVAVSFKKKSCNNTLESDRSAELQLDGRQILPDNLSVNIKGGLPNQSVVNLCKGDDLILESPYSAYSNQWQRSDTGDAGTFVSVVPNGSSGTLFTTAPGFYRVVISSPCDDNHNPKGPRVTNTIEVTNPSVNPPTIEFDQGEEAVFCNSSTIKATKISVTLTNFKGTASSASTISYFWEQSLDGGTTYKPLTSVTTNTYDYAEEGHYQVRAIIDGCNVPDEKPAKIHVYGSDQAPEPEILEDGAVYFCGDGFAQINAKTKGVSDSLRWMYSEEAIGPFTILDTAINSRLYTRTAGFYKLSLENDCGSGISDQTIEVIGTNEEPNTTISQGFEAVYCPGGDVFIDVPLQELYQYRWFYSETPDGEREQLPGFYGVSSNYPADKDGYYWAFVFFNGCAAWSDSIHVTESANGIPTPEFENGTKQGICAGETASLTTLTKGTGFFYNWSYSSVVDGPYNSISVTNSPTQDDITDPGFYRLTISKEGCGDAVETVELYQIANRPEADILQEGIVSVCKDNFTILESKDYNDVYEYQWRRYSNENVLDQYDIVEGMEGEPQSLETNLPGFYRLYVSNQGCGTISAPVELIRVDELDIPTFAQPSPTGFCPGEDALLEVEQKSSATYYRWFYSTTSGGTFEEIAGASGRGRDFSTHRTNTAGFYKASIEQTGCSAKQSAVIEVRGVNEPPAAIINEGATSIDACIGEIITLEAERVSGAEYQWDGPEGYISRNRQAEVNVLDVLNGGTYTLTTTLLGNCSNSSQIQLNVNELPKYTVLPPNVICTGDATGIIEFQSDDASLTYKFGENGTFSDQKVYEGLTAGKYDFTIQTPAGCQTTQMVEVEESDQLGVTLTAPNKTVNKGESVELSVSGANNYLWQPENPDEFVDGDLTDPTPLVAPLETTTYTVKGNSPAGCGIAQVTVEVVINYDIAPNNVITPNGDEVNDTWRVNMKYAYPNATIHIYDRWGLEVYTFSGTYEDDWAGTDGSGATLPTGAYSYVIEPNHSGDASLNKPIVGVVTIVNE